MGATDVELNLLAEFVLLARYLNFSKTAQELNLTQPTLSRHIVQLEEELGMQLFRRDKQSVTLTEAGALFLLVVDNISRNLYATELPIGILTAFVGAPFFLYLMMKGGDVT